MSKRRTQLDRDVERLHALEQEVFGVFVTAIRQRWSHSRIMERVSQIQPTRCKGKWCALALRKYVEGCYAMMYTHLEWRLYRKSDGALILSEEVPQTESYLDYIDVERTGHHTYIGHPESIYH